MLPNKVTVASAVVFLMAHILYAEVLRENTYLSRTIEVQENQKVIDTGLYGIVTFGEMQVKEVELDEGTI